MQVSVTEAVKPTIRCGDILLISNLKAQQNESLQHIAECMNNSLGIVMDPSTRTRRHRTEVRLQWIGDKSIGAGIKLKYLKKGFPSIYIHRLFGNCKYEQTHWSYITGLFRWLTKQNNEKNIVITQLDALPTFHNYRINIEDLAFPIYTAFNMICRVDWNNTAEIMGFLNYEFNFVSSSMFREVTDKLFSCKIVKKVSSIRKKLMPALIAIYKEQHELDEIERDAIIYNDTYAFVEKNVSSAKCKMAKLLNDPKTKRDYRTFFIKMEEVFESIAMDKMRKIMRIDNAKRAVLESEVRVEDLMNAYSYMDGSGGDLHVLSQINVFWDFPLIWSKLSWILNDIAFEHKEEIIDAIVKEVIHPPYRNLSYATT